MLIHHTKVVLGKEVASCNPAITKKIAAMVFIPTKVTCQKCIANMDSTDHYLRDHAGEI